MLTPVTTAIAPLAAGWRERTDAEGNVLDREGFKRWIVLVVIGLVITIAAVLIVSLAMDADWGGWITLAFGVFCALTGARMLPKRSG